MKVTATKAAFDETKHRVLLEKINPVVGVDCLISKIQDQTFTLYEIHADELFLGVFVSSVDSLLNGQRELVIRHASAVIKPSLPMTSVLNPVFNQVALDHGLRSIRIHSDKKGLDKILEENNYQFQEAVYRKVL